jgi:hypothetical protein
MYNVEIISMPPYTTFFHNASANLISIGVKAAYQDSKINKITNKLKLNSLKARAEDELNNTSKKSILIICIAKNIIIL